LLILVCLRGKEVMDVCQVLCHGLFGFDTLGIGLLPSYQIHYWHAVLDILKKRIGADVIVTAVPS
jgi:triacylglycerol lipase